jgi:sulfotransferase family protein
MTYDYQPLIVIGAARSGTKLARDLIAQHPAVDKIPYDVSYIWRLGNEDISHDELPVDRLTPHIRRRILEKFEAYRSGSPFLVEKTVGNCLRVPFVHAVFPDALFIHLIRDGRDVIESVYRQWLAPTDWGYLLAKARTFPVFEAFGYAFAYAKNASRRFLASNRNPRGTWGVRYAGIDNDVATKSLLEICAIQWVLSVEKAQEELSRLPAHRVLTIRYEDLAQNPETYLDRIAKFAGLDAERYPENLYRHLVSSRNIGKGLRSLTAEQLAVIQPCIEKTLSSLGYI